MTQSALQRVTVRAHSTVQSNIHGRNFVGTQAGAIESIIVT